MCSYLEWQQRWVAGGAEIVASGQMVRQREWKEHWLALTLTHLQNEWGRWRSEGKHRWYMSTSRPLICQVVVLAMWFVQQVVIVRASWSTCWCVPVTTCDRQSPITTLRIEGCPQAWFQEEKTPSAICLHYGIVKDRCSLKRPLKRHHE